MIYSAVSEEKRARSIDRSFSRSLPVSFSPVSACLSRRRNRSSLLSIAPNGAGRRKRPGVAIDVICTRAIIREKPKTFSETFIVMIIEPPEVKLESVDA